MLRRRVLTGAFACLLVLLAGTDAPLAAEPPDGEDPCARAGRNVCGTTGNGFYAETRYGIRWLGDFRGAVPGEAHLFCIDFRYWYASPKYRYRPAHGVLRNRAGAVVPLEHAQRLAYAIWRYGRSSDERRQAAVALYVHSLVGDARPHEADPAVLGPAGAALFRRIARDSALLHGPYRIEARYAGPLVVGERATARIRVLSARGHAVPGVKLALRIRGGAAEAHARTNAAGVARVSVTPGAAGVVRLAVVAGPLASTLPTVYRPTAGAAAPNGQRLAAPASQRVTAAVAAKAKRQVALRTAAPRSAVPVGGASSIRVVIRALPSWRGRVQVNVYGPFPSEGAVRCAGTPAWSGSVRARAGATRTPRARLREVGWYGYGQTVTGDERHHGLTQCEASRTAFRVVATPRVRTRISERSVQPGAAIFDRVVVSGLAGQGATVLAALYGPFPTRAAVSCAGRPVWSGSLTVAGDGEYRTDAVRLTMPGYYTYREWIAATGFIQATRTRCGEVSETTVVRARPSVETVVSAPVVGPGAELFDRIHVRGLGRAAAEIRVELFGPFPSRAAIDCEAAPRWTGLVTAHRNGTIPSPRVRLDRAGFYTYRERLLPSDRAEGVTTACALAAETSLVAPKILTGRGDPATRRRAAARRAAEGQPTRVRLGRLGIDAPVAPVEIDVAAGALGSPPDVRSAAWWVDGALPGSRSGTVLVTGHVDLADAGRGAFYTLRRARPGDRVTVTTAGGRTLAYRVVTVRRFRKDALPHSLFARTGPLRLALVTCGGPFDSAAGRYRDNVVLTAVPAAS